MKGDFLIGPGPFSFIADKLGVNSVCMKEIGWKHSTLFKMEKRANGAISYEKQRVDQGFSKNSRKNWWMPPNTETVECFHCSLCYVVKDG